MSWFNVWDGLKNKTCRYLLQRYLGQFLDEKLNLEQLNIELYNGKATIKNVSLRVEALNELLDAQGWPFEFTDGQIGLLTVSVPWNALMTNDSSIEASDVVLCLRPVKRAHEGHESMIESMWSSVSSSLQLAEECMRQEEEEEDESECTSRGVATGTIAGLEKFAETIDNVLNRIQAKFSNITLKIEYPCHYRLRGVALILHLNELFYKNETGNEKMPQMSSAESTNTQSEHLNRLPTYAKHSVKLTGVSMFTQENWISESECQVQHEDIPILQFMGQQNLQIKVKQSEEITGPKICFDVELGAICAIFSPRQLQLLTHFLEAFSEDESYRKPRTATYNPEEFELQREQQERYDSNLAHGNLNMWNCPPSNVKTTPTSNLYRNCENYCDSVASSSLSSSTITSVSRYQRKAPNIDSSAEISNFVIKVSALVGVILHEDILVESNSNSHQHFWNERSLKELLTIAQSFFTYAAQTSVERELSSPSLYCSKNHLFLRLNPIVAEGKQNRNQNILQISTSISATKVELCEVLEQQVTHLLRFNRNKNCFNGYQIRPEFTMNFSTSNCIKMKKNSRTNIDIMLEENILEFDITIIDRLGSFFAPSPYVNYSSQVAQSNLKEDLNTGNRTELTINCALLDLKLRFPIVDLRPLHDPLRVPWWKQNIRTDYLLLRFAKLKVILCESRLKLYGSQIEILYAETDDLQNHLLTATYDKQLNKPLMENYPSILIDFAERNFASLETNSETKLPFSSKRHCRQSSTSSYNNKMENDLTENILLPGEKHEIDEFCETTMANSEIQVKLNFPHVDFIIESKQLYEVIYNRLNSDLFMWEPSCPYITKSSAMDSQQQMGQSLLNMGLMDSVYISAIAQNDESFATATHSLSSSKPPLVFEQSDQSDDNQEQEEDLEIDEDDDGISVKQQQPPQTFAAKMSQHNCSVEILLGKVSGSCFVPVRDNDKHVLPQVCGKFLLNVEKVKIFLVAGFKSDLNLSYLCTQINSGEIYHCGIVPMNTPLRFDHQAKVEDFMQSTLYKIPLGLTKGIVVPEQDNDMFSIVIEMKKNPQQRIKRIKITAGIHYTTLRYNPSSPSLYWLNQLIDFLDVVDYPIEGYKAFSVLSEMQLHLWDCAIDFRPENFSYRAVLELFYFSICSNIIPSMPCCNLRFVLEECVLSLAPYEESLHKKYPCYMVSFIDAKSLVPVLDVGLLDISLRLNDEDSDKCPTFDLRCSIHDVHFRTCYDSGSAFAQLIGYMANNTNPSNEQTNLKEQSLQSSLSSESDFFLSQTEQQLTKEITKKQQERVNILMAEAVQESPEESCTLETIDEEEPIRGKDELKLFYFPDENNKHLIKQEANVTTETMEKSTLNTASSSKETLPTLPIIKAEFGEITEEDNALFEELHNGSSNEEDYCIIAEEEHAFVNTKLSTGAVEVSDDPLMIVDNHFCLPSSSSNDLLRTPTNFPMPEQRYTLCEMTFTWHLYGGHDFPTTSSSAGGKTPATTASAGTGGETSANKTAMSDTYRQGVFYANESSHLPQVKKPKEKLTWKSVGGSSRNHEVLVEMQFTKVRFSYEVYPRHTMYASRQVLMVNEIEIRDRLQSSEINKFLYNANTKSFSNRRNQHMVLVKAIHVRPNPQQSNNQECSLRISLCPLRVHIDQDTLEFLTDFFTNFGKACDKDNSTDKSTEEGKPSKLAVAKTEVPIMTITEDEQEIPDAVNDLRARRIVNENISLLIDEQESADSRSIKSDNSVMSASPEVNNAPIYFREIVFTPDVSIRFDYHGRRVELSKGPIAGLLMGLGQLQCSEIILRKIVYRRGLLGFEKVCNYLCKEWLRDIKRNQLPKILSGVGPTYAFVQLFQGIYDLFWLPIEHYQKDGRLIRGLQLGAQSFSARTILAALEITSRLIQLLQFTAETAFDMVSSGPSVRQSKKSKRGRKKRHNRPKDIREGVANAYQILKEGINDSANNLIETAAAEHDQKGLTGAVGAVMRQVPQLVVCPAVLATQATTNILGGVKSSLVPEAKLEAKEKWKDDNC
ncbi:autophagy-related protein 2 homolog A [Lucilia cuprina]|uniref:autophagy-related protein 2 homolog A n=1 Tax=Lucilia cuprina TaxID=7375 RepID=UPI001F06400C|nr:autophagy-related protein 2 homolog A [Lucilia cuprina]